MQHRPDSDQTPQAKRLVTKRGDTIFLAVLVASYPLAQFTRTLLDNVVTVRDLGGTTYFLSDGSSGPALQAGLLIFAAALSMNTIIFALRSRTFMTSWWMVIVILLLIADVGRGQSGVADLSVLLLSTVLIIGAAHIRVTQASIRTIAGISVVVALSNVTFAIVDPSRGWDLCREDKCGVTGQILRGYFPQENVLALYLVALLPAVAFLRRRSTRIVCMLSIGLSVGMTGSRTAAIAVALALVAYAMLRRRLSERSALSATEIAFCFLPFICFVFSTALFFLIDSYQFTGRGLIYDIVRSAWLKEPILGPGSDIVTGAYARGEIGWYVAHEHGEAAFVLARIGILGWILVVCALISLATESARSSSIVPIAFAVTPALFFITEPSWTFTASSPIFWSLALTIALASMLRRGESLPKASNKEPSAPRQQGKKRR